MFLAFQDAPDLEPNTVFQYRWLPNTHLAGYEPTPSPNGAKQKDKTGQNIRPE